MKCLQKHTYHFEIPARAKLEYANYEKMSFFVFFLIFSRFSTFAEAQECGGEVDLFTGFITSPGFEEGEEYAARLECVWVAISFLSKIKNFL